METLIHNYLKHYYYIGTSDSGNDGIYSLEDTRRFKAPVNGDNLIKELVKLFYIDEQTLNYYIQNWVKLNNNETDLTFFWKVINVHTII